VHVKAAIENTKYYLNKNGKMQTGWQKIGGKWYYMDKNGALQESKWISGIYYVKVDGQSVRLMKDHFQPIFCQPVCILPFLFK
jgi:glucan-binding YG repeat protein